MESRRGRANADGGTGPTGATGPPVTVEPVNGFEILDKLAGLPIATWRYEWEPADVRHLGPMAQDWKATFGLGDADTVIPTVDANGVALVCIQALVRRLDELEAQLEQLRTQVAALTDAAPQPPDRQRQP